MSEYREITIKCSDIELCANFDIISSCRFQTNTINFFDADQYITLIVMSIVIIVRTNMHKIELYILINLWRSHEEDYVHKVYMES